MEGTRASTGIVIVEGKINFDYEITLLTVRHKAGISFCGRVGHIQIDGDYRESWQPQALDPAVLDRAQQVSAAVVANLILDGRVRVVVGRAVVAR